MSVEETGYYDNFCLYCNGSGVVEGWDREEECSACCGRGQWDDPGRNPTMSKHVETAWEYGFYDSETGPNPIWWYTFGGLVGFESAEQAEHTASKSTWGAPVIVRRRKGETEWEQVSDVER